MQRGEHFLRPVDENLFCFRSLLPDDHGDPLFDDPPFFSSDEGQGIPKHIHMVKIDICDHRKEGHDHVRTVQPPPQSGLDNRKVNFFTGETGEGQCNCHFEEGRFDLLPAFPVPGDKTAHSAPGDQLAIDLDPLPEVGIMGRCIQADPKSMGLEDCSKEMGYRTFPVGTGDMDGWERTLRVTEALKQQPDIPEVFFERLFADPLVHRQLGKQVLNRFLVLHHSRIDPIGIKYLYLKADSFTLTKISVLMFRMIILSFAMVLFFGSCADRNNSVDVPEISEADIEKHLSTLASDEFLGRKPMTEGETKTIRYLEEELRAMGVQPGNGDRFLQEVPLVNITGHPDETMEITGGRQDMVLELGDDFVIYTERETDATSLDASDLVFCGYGIVAPEYNWDDYAGLDMKGKTAVVLVNDPGFGMEDSTFFKGNTMTYYGRWTYKYEEAERQGAAGIMIVHETAMAGYPWFVVESSWSGGQQQLQSADGNMKKPAVQGWFSLDAAKELFSNAGMDLSQELRAARQPGFKPKPMGMQASASLTNTFEKGLSNNVIGLLPGTKRPNEYVIYTAHWDHLGVGKVVDGDSIYNGAVDNASGVACVLAIARSLAAMEPGPERSVVFLFVTAEEQGLLGSAYYGQNPVFPTHQTVANLNIDGMRTFGEMKDLTVIGFGQSDLEDLAARIAKEEGRYILPDQEPEKGYFFRSDHFSLAKVGVPALYAEGGYDHMTKGKEFAMSQQEAYRANDYHAPGDEYDPEKWDLSGLSQDARLYLQVGIELANSTDFPEWKEGSEFKAIREKDLSENRLKG